MPRAINRCPRCGEPVSPFAAGCAICGTDLDRARANLASRRRIGLPSMRWSGPRPSSDWLNIAVALILAVTVSPIGFVLALYWASQRYQNGETMMMIVMLAAAAISVAAFLTPGWFWSQLYG